MRLNVTAHNYDAQAVQITNMLIILSPVETALIWLLQKCYLIL